MTHAVRLDMLKTQLQETGRCNAFALSVAEMVDLVESLGLDAREIRLYGSLGDFYLFVPSKPPAAKGGER